MKKSNKQTLIWVGALVLGVVLGLLNVEMINSTMTVLAQIFARLFQLIAIPTIAVAVVATMMNLGAEKGTVKIFRCAMTYTLLTTIIAAAVGVSIYYIVSPSNLSADFMANGDAAVSADFSGESYSDHLLNVIPNNLLTPLLDGNVLGVLLMAFAIGIGISKLPESNSKTTLKSFIEGVQNLLFLLIKWLIAILPIALWRLQHN